MGFDEDGAGNRQWRRELDLPNALASGLHTDLILVSKENLHIGVHKIVLSRDPFWYSLFRKTECCVGNCSSEPTTVLLPDYNYRTLLKMVEGYYQGKCYFKTEEEASDFLNLVRTFNKNINKQNLKCRVCEKEQEAKDVVAHMLDHLRTAARRDILAFQKGTAKDIIRCSFTLPLPCQIEKDRTTMINGIYNDCNVEKAEDMVMRIKEHYRRHLRDEVAYLKKNCDVAIPAEETLYSAAGIEKNEVNKNATQSRKRNGSEGRSSSEDAKRNKLSKAQDRSEQEDEDSDAFSGGLSSPDCSDEEAMKTVPDEGQKKKKTKKKPVLSKKWVTEDEEESEKVGDNKMKKQCRKCPKIVSSKTGLERHIITHLRDEWDLDGEGPFTCDQYTCDKTKSWTKVKFINHLAIYHRQIEDKLKARNETLSDYEEEVKKTSVQTDEPKKTEDTIATNDDRARSQNASGLESEKATETTVVSGDDTPKQGEKAATDQDPKLGSIDFERLSTTSNQDSDTESDDSRNTIPYEDLNTGYTST